VKLGCSTYSYHRAFETGKIDVEGFLEKMFRLNVAGVEFLDMHLIPKPENLRRLKRSAFKLGIEIAALTIDPCVEVKSVSPREFQKVAEPEEKINKWIDIASLMGASVLRVNVIRTPEKTPEEAIKANVDCLRRCIPHATKKGIIMGIENHSGVTSTAEGILKIVKGVDSEWYGIVLDFGNFGFEEKAYEEMEKVAPYTVFCHAKTYEMGLGWQGQECYWEEKRIDYRKVMNILGRSGYNGYLSLEYEGNEAEETAVPKGIDFLKRLIKT
jgi:L-ribulose-5-phosphate 3-epimerase